MDEQQRQDQARMLLAMRSTPPMEAASAEPPISMTVSARNPVPPSSAKRASVSPPRPRRLCPRPRPASASSEDGGSAESSDDDTAVNGRDASDHGRQRAKKRACTGAGEKDAKPTRKPTYLVRKEEKELLVKEIAFLEAQADYLKQKLGVHKQSHANGREDGRALPWRLQAFHLAEAKRHHKLMDEALAKHIRHMSSLQSLLGKYSTQFHRANPVRTTIQLGRDWNGRRDTLVAMKPAKVQAAMDYVHDRLKHLDESKPYLMEEKFVSATGDLVCVRHDIVLFPGVKSVRQVFDALVFYLFNMEISISETLGDITIREDYDVVDHSISNHRIVSAFGKSFVQEVNAVLFHEFRTDANIGIVAADCVDDDELNPYVPSQRIRKDITTGVVISAVDQQSGESQDGLLVVMKRCAHLMMFKSELVTTHKARSELLDGIEKWGDVMINTMREQLYGPSQQAA